MYMMYMWCTWSRRWWTWSGRWWRRSRWWWTWAGRGLKANQTLPGIPGILGICGIPGINMLERKPWKFHCLLFSQFPCSCCPGLEFQCGVIFRWVEWSATWNPPVLYPPTPEPLQKCPANRWAITSIIINIIKSHPYMIFSDTFTRQDRTNMCWYCTFKWIDPNQNSFKTLIFKLFALLDHYFKFFFANQCINLVSFKAFTMPCRQEVKN